MFSNVTKLRSLLLVFALIVMIAPNSHAGVGLMGGGTIATVWGNDAAETGFRNGFNAGILLDIPLGENVSLRPEAMFVQKGTQTDTYNPFSGSLIESKGMVDYVEFPLLISVKLNRASSVTTVFNIGPAVAVPLTAQVDLGGNVYDVANIHDFDFSAIIGAGLELGSGSTRFIIDFRTDIGLTDMFLDMTDQEIAQAVSKDNPQLPIVDVDGNSGLEYKNFTMHLSAGIMF